MRTAGFQHARTNFPCDDPGLIQRISQNAEEFQERKSGSGKESAE
jgi:hypothetical protein